MKLGENMDANNPRFQLFLFLNQLLPEKDFELYFRKKNDLKINTKIINNDFQGFLSPDLTAIFKSIEYDKILKVIVKDSYRNSFISSYEKVKKAIQSNNIGITLNTLCQGLFGPVFNPNKETQQYNAYAEMFFKTIDFKKLSKEIDEKLKLFRNEYISINELTDICFPDATIPKEALSIKENTSHISNEKIENDIEENDEVNELEIDSRNVIFFGPPGTGKSYKMNEYAKNIRVGSLNVIRTTFHPEFSYYDFIGQYKPITGFELTSNKITNSNGNELKDNELYKKPIIYYDFVPGPFTKTIIKALASHESNENTLLIIEEINRGNCAAIFGDIFQLLDRVNNVNLISDYGRSQYPIEIPEEMKRYITEKLSWNEIKWNNIFPKGFVLPSNLYIYATMNTSDQSLFPMDSAFKRRWTMEYININYEQPELYNRFLPMPYDKIKWLNFIKVINKIIVDFTQTDDKQIGQWFISSVITDNEFVGKLLSFLWFDVFRQEPSIIFKDEINTYDDIIKFYKTGVIKDEIIEEMKK
jgi:hypothetical protein